VSAPILTQQPIDEIRHQFISDRPLTLDDGPRKFTAVEEAGDTPVAAAVLSIEGVSEVVIDGSVVTVVREPSGPGWNHLVPRIEYAVTTAFTPAPVAPSPAPTDRPATGMADDDTIYDQVEQIFRDEVNPIVAQHGGAIDLIDVQDATVVVRMSGGCQGCGMANVTLRQGIEAALRKTIPSLNGVRDVTDHSSGSDPYFASAGK
jgi:Fe-S cluster biogenesis protein NfuA